MKEIDYETLKSWETEKKDFTLIDVREPDEHGSFNIGGRLIPLGDLLKRADEIPEDIPVVFYCKRGIRSQIAIQKLSRIKDNSAFINLRGGILPHMKK